MGDVTIPDSTILHLSEPFTKTWRLRNSGTCTWTTAYKLIFAGGDRMGGPEVLALPVNVAPAQTIDLSVNLSAPGASGHYEGDWQLQAADGKTFGVGESFANPIWVKIRVIAPAFSTVTTLPGATGTAVTPTPAVSVTATTEAGVTIAMSYDFAANVCAAQWQSNTGMLPCPGLSGDPNGFVIDLPQAHLEDGSTSSLPTLLTFPEASPEGYILGLYPQYEVKAGDHFQTAVGCEQNATGCSALFRVSYLDSAGTPHDLWSLGEFYDGKYFNLDLDLSALAGQKIQFVLNVGALGSPTDDRALWVAPRIIRLPVSEPTATSSSTPTVPATPARTATPSAVPSAAASVTPQATAAPALPTAAPSPSPSIQQIIDSIVSFFRQLFGGQ